MDVEGCLRGFTFGLEFGIYRTYESQWHKGVSRELFALVQFCLEGAKIRNMTKKKGINASIGKNTLKLYVPHRLFTLILTISLLAFIALYIFYSDMIEREMLFWFFAATSQSMAALLAIIGMMAVFRYQDMQMRLRNLYDSIKKYIAGGDVL